jgi:hypothetical protein
MSVCVLIVFPFNQHIVCRMLDDVKIYQKKKKARLPNLVEIISVIVTRKYMACTCVIVNGTGTTSAILCECLTIRMFVSFCHFKVQTLYEHEAKAMLMFISQNFNFQP